MERRLIVLAGGASLRFGGSSAITKPLVKISGRPMIEHVVRPFLNFGVTEIHVAAGSNFEAVSDCLKDSDMPFVVHDTGESTATGGRLKAIARTLDHSSYFVCYADGLANLDVNKLSRHHTKAQTMVTATLCNPRSSYGIAAINGDHIERFEEKPILSQMWANGGFYIVDRAAIEFISVDMTSWEEDILPDLAKTRNLSGFKHTGDWVSVDSQKDLPAAESVIQKWGYG